MTKQREPIVIERTYRADIREIWELWTTKDGFESWWGPEGFRVEVRELEAREGGALHYDMIADTPEMIAAMAKLGRPASHTARSKFSRVVAYQQLEITTVIDFVPGVEAYESTIAVDFHVQGDSVRMVVTLAPMHDEQMTRMSTMGFSSQLGKLDRRFGSGPPRTKIFPHLWYAKDADQAALFYASIFPDSRVDRITPLMSETPSGPPGSVKVVDFTLLGQRFQAMSAGPHHEFNDAISMVVLCDDQAQLDRYWSALLEGGGKEVACGWLIDRFGVRWQIVPAALDSMMSDGDPARSKAVSDALMKMVKPDIAKLEAAFRGSSG
jgi:predicted 3-demethylubiquinone-9 3-methyltransferase (glyoxalase superfamily)/uncharacterized protein YndB with AHSA1/START domain